jgi:hypothetical protein
MEHFAGTDFPNRQEQLLLHHLVITQLILGNPNYHHSDPEVGKILLKLEVAVDGHEHVELFLGGGQQQTIFERTPGFVVNRGRLMIQEKRLDSRIYAFVNKDAHSKIWWLAKSRTATTCCRVMDG